MAKKKNPNKSGKNSKPPIKTSQATPEEHQPKTLEAQAPAIQAEELDEIDDSAFPIVGIGASAGGLEACTELLQNLPPDTGMGFVFVQHLDPKHASLLTELLQRHTSMAVAEATNGVRVEPNHLYIIPRNTHMSLVRGVLTLSPRLDSPSPHMPIDPFLRSLAADRRSKAIGIILSGSASDGALGMMAIKAAGGITFAQSSDSAKYDGMPRSAIASGCIDFVASPKEIAQELARLGQHPYIARTTPSADGDLSVNESIPKILTLLRNATGVDFSYYKPTTLRRRILRRMALRRLDNLERYISKLRSDSSELHALYEDILINVTEFFRDPEVFDALKQIVFPKILAARAAGGPIRIWVPGCSSGEEVYSIAMVLLEHLGERSNEIPIQIFGTDISDIALDKARSGTYAPSLVEGISPERIRRFFTKVDSNYVISKRIREVCVFAKQNLIRDPPFSKIDLLSCRNVLIYLGPILQKRLIPVFHYALKPSGFLLLGTSETIGATDLFSMVDKKNRIYARLQGSEHLPLELPPEGVVHETRELHPHKQDWTEIELSREADRIVLGRYSPAGVVVDNDFNVVQFRGRTSAYLEPPSGVATLNVIAMAREGMGPELRAAMIKARNEKLTVRRESVRVRRDSGFALINLEVIPFKKAAAREGRFLVLFEDALESKVSLDRKPGKKRLSSTALERNNDQLRQELAGTKEYLQSVIEQHESSNEELRSANEEIQSSNEELQSTNEELETAKEELQSTNEELNTVNEELQTRNLQLAQAGNDLLNLLSNVNIPIVMVGNDLRIRRFTPVSQRLLNLIPSDVGRPISDINLNLEVQKLDRMLSEVMESLTPITLNVRDLSGRPYSLRIRPYRTEDNKIDGAVIVLVDLDSGRAVAEPLQSGGSFLSSDVQSEALRAFSAGILIAQERERRNIAMEIHDDITQRLALIDLSLQSMQRVPPTGDELQRQFRTIHEQVTALTDILRRISQQLHPSVVEDLGLVPALDAYVRDFSKQHSIKVVFQTESIPGKIDRQAAVGLYRITQEALHNVLKHSRAKSAQVILSGTDHGSLQLKISDTGKGFDTEHMAEEHGLGLRIMAERARLVGGTLGISSRPGDGTTLTVSIPQGTDRGEEKA